MLIILTIFVRHNNWLEYYDFLKPLTTLSIIAIPLIHLLKGCENRPYTLVIIAALIFCLGGDILLLRDQWFVYGLSSFLVGHLLFVAGSVYLVGIKVKPIVVGIIAFFCIGYFAYLSGHDLGKFKFPIAVYIFVIASMIIQYISTGLAIPKKIFLQLAFASILFGFSDAIIAYTKFVKPLFFGKILILTTYWISITIIATSTENNRVIS